MKHPVAGALLVLFLCLALPACGGQRPARPSAAPTLPSPEQIAQALETVEGKTASRSFSGTVWEAGWGACWLYPDDGSGYLIKVPLTFETWRTLRPGQRLRVTGRVRAAQVRTVIWRDQVMLLPCLTLAPGCALERIGTAP